MWCNGIKIYVQWQVISKRSLRSICRLSSPDNIMRLDEQIREIKVPSILHPCKSAPSLHWTTRTSGRKDLVLFETGFDERLLKPYLRWMCSFKVLCLRGDHLLAKPSLLQARIPLLHHLLLWTGDTLCEPIQKGILCGVTSRSKKAWGEGIFWDPRVTLLTVGSLVKEKTIPTAICLTLLSWFP